MRTSGKGNELLMGLVPGGVLAFFVVWMYGGPGEFLKALNSMLRQLADFLSTFISSFF